jgi:hypothetical protein
MHIYMGDCLTLLLLKCFLDCESLSFSLTEIARVHVTALNKSATRVCLLLLLFAARTHIHSRSK